MKQLDLTSEQIHSLRSTCKTIEELLLQVEQDQQAAGNVVCQFVINGIKLSESDENRMKNLSTNDLESLSVFFEKPENLLIEIIQNWRNEIPKIVDHADQLSAQIREQGVENHLTSFIQLVESCQLLVQSLMSLSNVIDTHKLFDTGQWFLCEKMLAEAVGETLRTFDQRETRILSDVIEYDLANALVSWIEIFNLLEQVIQSTPTQSPFIKRDAP